MSTVDTGSSRLSRLFNPSSVAVVGASRSPGKVGHAVVRNLLASGFGGEIVPVNPGESNILGLNTFPSVSAYGPADVVVVAVPARLVLQVAEDAGKAGAGFLVVLSAGFKEIGHEGLLRERELLDIARRYDMRVIGPNTMGVMDTHTPINASFAANFPLKGHVAFFSQSGALCAATLDWSLERGLGFSRFVSIGNKADLDEADFIVDAALDENSRSILIYMESVSDGAGFLRAARDATPHTPIVVLKSGRSDSGAQAASSHTGALAGSDRAYETAFRQSGILRAHTMEDLFNLAQAFAQQPIPRGNRVAVVTNAGGTGIITADAIEEAGLVMARLSRQTMERLREGLPDEASVQNPVDVIGDAGPKRYSFALTVTIEDPNVDSVVALLCPTAFTDPESTAREIVELRHKYPEMPLFAVFTGGKAVREGARVLEENGVSCFFFPEPAIRTLRGITDYGRMRGRPAPRRDELVSGDSARVKEILDKVRASGRNVLLGHESMAVVSAYGVPAINSSIATTADEAVSLAESMGYPVALKASSSKILHKTEVGGVRLNIKDADGVRETFGSILDRVHRHLPLTPLEGIEVQEMAKPGQETIIGMSRDLQFGPLVVFGMGGIYVNLLEEVSFRLADGMDRREARAMIEETKAYSLLRGFRGADASDITAVENVILGVTALVTDFPEIVELDINPLFTYPDGAKALDVKITLAEGEAQ